VFSSGRSTKSASRTGVGVHILVLPEGTFAIDLTALRSVPARFFGIFMSVNPVLAALAGVVILRQVPTLHEAVGIGTIRPSRTRGTSRVTSASTL
jgi:inner membrane transporter RhtA